MAPQQSWHPDSPAGSGEPVGAGPNSPSAAAGSAVRLRPGQPGQRGLPRFPRHLQPLTCGVPANPSSGGGHHPREGGRPGPGLGAKFLCTELPGAARGQGSGPAGQTPAPPAATAAPSLPPLPPPPAGPGLLPAAWVHLCPRSSPHPLSPLQMTNALGLLGTWPRPSPGPAVPTVPAGPQMDRMGNSSLVLTCHQVNPPLCVSGSPLSVGRGPGWPCWHLGPSAMSLGQTSEAAADQGTRAGEGALSRTWRVGARDGRSVPGTELG